MDKQRKIYELNRLLANYFVLYIKLHRYEWFVKGAHVFSLRDVFRHMQSIVKHDIDELAAHILLIGGKPFATMIKFIKEASIEEASADDEEEEIIDQLIHDLEIMIDMIEAMDTADHQMTAHFLTALQVSLQKQVMQFHAHQDNR